MCRNGNMDESSLNILKTKAERLVSISICLSIKKKRQYTDQSHKLRAFNVAHLCHFVLSVSPKYCLGAMSSG